VNNRIIPGPRKTSKIIPIDTKFPTNGTEQQTVYGFLALLQYAIDENKDDPLKLKFIELSLLGISSMYTMFDGSNIGDITGISTAIFMKLEGKTEA